MTSNQLETDYLIIGAGAMGMAFADVLMSETDARLVIVDRHDRPGGHWNDSYPFVRLHQPSAFYGVNSRPLGTDQIDATGWNAGLYELASGTEVVTYFEQVMQQQFLPTGRVTYLPMSEYLGAGRVRSLVSGAETTIEVAARTVDATYMNVQVPSVRPPTYDVAPEVRCVPLNELPRVLAPADGYVVVGAGKTAMDACLWLLRNGLDPDQITWIMPRDSWLLDRRNIQPGKFADRAILGLSQQMEAIAASTSYEDMFDRLEAFGGLLRLDANVRPTMYRCATVTPAELEQLRRIEHIVRLGRVQAINAREIILADGRVPSSGDKLYVDCTGDALARRAVVDVFAEDQITLQTVRTCQQVFSAAFIAHIEVTGASEAQKNALCTVVPHPNSDLDWLRTTLGNARNTARWAEHPALTDWLMDARLDGFSRRPSEEETAAAQSRRAASEQPPAEVADRLRQMQSTAVEAQQKLVVYIAEQADRGDAIAS